MGRIKLLDSLTANGIAAGEVVERPSSVVKELVENALDAGASVVTVEITNGGIKMIRVTDNGCGMDAEDAVNAFSCHATSKLSRLEDLSSISTMGFRGEALSSISAVSRVLLKTIPVGEEYGTIVELESGKVIRKEKATGIWGTSIEVRDLFYNMPARYKFLKKDQTEAQYITILCERFALVRPDVSFRLIKNDKEILHTPGNNDARSSLYSIYGNDVVNNCIPLESEHGKIIVRGFAGKPILARSGRGEQTIFVNDRIIRSKTIAAAIDEAYKTLLMKKKYAFVILMIYVPSALVDVNVHPQKSEVRFWNDSEVFRAVYHTLHGALMSEPLVNDLNAPSEPYSPGSDQTGDSVDQTRDGQPMIAKSESPIYRQGVLSSAESVISEQAAVIYENDNMNRSQKDQNSKSFKTEHVLSDKINREKASGKSFDRGNYDRSRDCVLNEIKDSLYIGTLFGTYILLQSESNLIILDQHAAHEKILFEKLVKDRASQKDYSVPSQQLLSPAALTLSPSDLEFAQNNQNRFRELGFDFDRMGEKDIAIRFAPSFGDGKNVSSLFADVLDQLKNDLETTDDEKLLILATAACKAAVKAHDRLDPIEVRSLIESLVILDNPFSCPHGRPIIIRYSKRDLEKEFKRIV